MSRTEELLKLCEVATPGPWRYTANGVIGSDAMPPEQFIVLWDDDGRNRFNDYPFIAACNPETIKQLIALVRLQHEALKWAAEVDSAYDGEPADELAEAIAAFNRFEQGGE